MLLWCFFLVFAFSIGLAEKNCGRTRVIYPAPVFGAGDNLSADKCGVWNQQINGFGPWFVKIRSPTSGRWCDGTLISPTSVLSDYCARTAKEFAESENKNDFKAWLGKCAPWGSDKVKCVERGEGQIVKVKSVTKLNAPGYHRELHIWKIEKATLKENYIAPICIFNKGNGQDFHQKQQYAAFDYEWKNSTKVSAEMFEDFGPCLNKSEDFTTCDKVHDNFLCARLSDNWRRYLSHQENNRHFLRALRVEWNQQRDLFYYDIFPLLDQISSASGDIFLMPQIPPTKKKIVFKNSQSFPGCGVPTFSRRRRQMADFIVQGKNANQNAHPWHVALLNGNFGYFCGGTLVSTTAVLTAAHCVFGKDRIVLEPDEFELVFGTVEMRVLLSNDSNKQTIYPLKVIPHPDYNRVTKEQDLAVVVLEKPVTITATVKPICLWQGEYSLDKNLRKNGKVVGWGRTVDQRVSEILQEAELRIVPYMECFLKDTNFFSKYLKPTKNFCAGENGTTACIGDSGGGFYMYSRGTWYLRGIVSFGWAKNATIDGEVVPTCEGKIPSLYLDVTNNMDWIVQNANLTDHVMAP